MCHNGRETFEQGDPATSGKTLQCVEASNSCRVAGDGGWR